MVNLDPGLENLEKLWNPEESSNNDKIQKTDRISCFLNTCRRLSALGTQIPSVWRLRRQEILPFAYVPRIQDFNALYPQNPQTTPPPHPTPKTYVPENLLSGALCFKLHENLEPQSAEAGQAPAGHSSIESHWGWPSIHQLCVVHVGAWL